MPLPIIAGIIVRAAVGYAVKAGARMASKAAAKRAAAAAAVAAKTASKKLTHDSKGKKPCKKCDENDKTKPKKIDLSKYEKSLKGKSYKESENILDKDLRDQGWNKGPMKKGDGVRYNDGKGNSIILEKGWPGAKDPLHSGPYTKISTNGQIKRVPLQGNPTLP